MGPRHPVFFGTAQRFPVQGYHSLRHGRCARETPNDTVGPDAQVCLERVSIYMPKDGVERGGTGRSVGEAKRLCDPRAVIASPFGNSAIAASATQHCTARQREDGG